MTPAVEVEENRLISLREGRVRRKLATKGYVLNKVPARSWIRIEYGIGYMVSLSNYVKLGCCTRPYEASLEEVEEFAEEAPSDW